jgi:hypothetical protein
MKHNLKEIWADGQDFVEKTAAAIVAESTRIRENRISDEDSAAGKTTLVDLTDPGGLVSEIVDWIVSSSSRPSRELALAATLPFVGALLGRRFASPSDLRTNLYVVGLAGSGYGKDHARTQLKRLFTTAGLDRFAGPNRFMSASALRVALMAKPSCLCMVDEFGGMMRQLNDRKAGIHSQLIRSDLLEIFSSADTYFEGAAYAGSATPEKLHNPNLCMYGTSTSEDFWASVSSLNTTDGLLPRFMLFDVTGPKPVRVEPANSVYYVPDSLVESCRALALAGRGGGNISNVDLGNVPVKPVVVQYSPEAAAELARFEASIEERENLATPESLPILNRAVEHAIKLALTVVGSLDAHALPGDELFLNRLHPPDTPNGGGIFLSSGSNNEKRNERLYRCGRQNR